MPAIQEGMPELVAPCNGFGGLSSLLVALTQYLTDTNVNALEFINRVKLHAFDWKWTHQHQDIGVIADELEQLDPLLVVGGGEDPDGHPIYKSINNLYLIGYLIGAVQELSDKVKKLEEERHDCD